MQVSSSLPSTERTRGEGLGSKETVEEEEEMMGEGRYEIGYISEENNVFSFFFSSRRFVSSLCSESKRFVIYHFRFFLVLCIMSDLLLPSCQACGRLEQETVRLRALFEGRGDMEAELEAQLRMCRGTGFRTTLKHGLK